MSRTPRAFRFRRRDAARMPGAASLASSAALSMSLVLAAVLACAGPLRAAESESDAHRGHHGTAMTDEAMRAEAAAYWATHERVGASPQRSLGTPAATFLVSGFKFENGDPTAVDTARIAVGQSVAWQWASGFHTVTSGTDSSDPQAGILFNVPSDSGNPLFTYQFDAPGTYPFFCVFHELANMFGVVVVSNTTGVGPSPGGGRLGFTRDPAPNPSRSGIRFEYALASPGRVLAEVFDAGGRRVAVIVDGDLPAGSFSASWNGRTLSGASRTGVYYVRLRLPGYDESRQVVIRR